MKLTNLLTLKSLDKLLRTMRMRPRLRQHKLGLPTLSERAPQSMRCWWRLNQASKPYLSSLNMETQLRSSSLTVSELQYLHRTLDPTTSTSSLMKRDWRTTTSLSQLREWSISAQRRVRSQTRETRVKLSLLNSFLCLIGCNSQQCSTSLRPWSSLSTT